MMKRTSFYALIISVIFVLISTGGTLATWKYASSNPLIETSDLLFNIEGFNFEPDIPDGEAALLNRIYDILNQTFTTDEIQDAKQFLLEETIQVTWEQGSAPYVGSMDKDYATQIHMLFGDILDSINVSFILKNQDLNYDGYNEIACYTTSDPLDYAQNNNCTGIVGVYLTVFTPVVDENFEIVGYQLVCDSLHGFCYEVNYNPLNPNVSSFSTDDWRDNVVYWHHEHGTQPITDDALGIDGKTLCRYHYDSYHYGRFYYEGYPWDGYTGLWIEGRRASEVLAGKIPYIYNPNY